MRVSAVGGLPGAEPERPSAWLEMAALWAMSAFARELSPSSSVRDLEEVRPRLLRESRDLAGDARALVPLPEPGALVVQRMVLAMLDSGSPRWAAHAVLLSAVLVERESLCDSCAVVCPLPAEEAGGGSSAGVPPGWVLVSDQDGESVLSAALVLHRDGLALEEALASARLL